MAIFAYAITRLPDPESRLPLAPPKPGKDIPSVKRVPKAVTDEDAYFLELEERKKART